METKHQQELPLVDHHQTLTEDQKIRYGIQLWFACQGPEVAMIEEMVVAGADLNFRLTPHGMTPLMLCIKHYLSSSESDAKPCTIYRLLIQHGANVNAADGDGQTPLYLAVDANDPDLVEDLLESGADPDTYWNGQPLFNLALRREAYNQYGVPTLSSKLSAAFIRHGAKVDLPDISGFNPLITAFFIASRDKDSKDVTEASIKELLLRKNINGRLANGQTLSNIACRYYRVYPWLLKELLYLKPKVKTNQEGRDQCDSSLPSLLYTAFFHNQKDPEVIQLVSQSGVNVTKELAAFQWECIFFETSNTHHRYFNLLLKHGADVNAMDSDGFTPIMKLLTVSQDLSCPSSPYKTTPELVCRVVIYVNSLINAGAMPKTLSTKPPFTTVDCPPSDWFDVNKITPLFAAFWTLNVEVTRLLLEYNFLHSVDLDLQNWGTGVMHFRLLATKDSQIADIFYNYVTQPRSLFTLCFVKISMRLGFHPNRREKVVETELPQPLQDLLMFKKPGVISSYLGKMFIKVRKQFKIEN